MKRIYIFVILTTAVVHDRAKVSTQDADVVSRALPPRALPPPCVADPCVADPRVPHCAILLSLGLLPGRLCCPTARSHRLSFGALSS